MYIETPPFDFSHSDSIRISFLIRCFGHTFLESKRNGGNLQYTTDGGQNWIVLNDHYGTASNWYNYTSLHRLDDEPGWAGDPQTLVTAINDISFLKGNSDVVFRFKYRSNYAPMDLYSKKGLAVDDFLIQTFPCDYSLSAAVDTIAATCDTTAEFSIPYCVSNSGYSSGEESNTEIYLSDNDVLDVNDQLLTTLLQDQIIPGTSLNDTAHVSFSFSALQSEYYIFIITDAFDSIIETDELNNIDTVFLKIFPHIDLYTELQVDSIHFTSVNDSIFIPYTIFNFGADVCLSGQTNIFISDNSSLNYNDIFVTSKPFGNLLPNGHIVDSVSINSLSSLVADSVFYLIFESTPSSGLNDCFIDNNIDAVKMLYDAFVSSNDVGLDEIRVFFVNDELIVHYPKTECITSDIIVVNGIGQYIFSQTIDLNQGSNSIPIHKLSASGIYYVMIVNNCLNEKFKILIQ